MVAGGPEGEQAVALNLADGPALRLNAAGKRVEVPGEQHRHGFGLEALGQAGEAGDVGEHHHAQLVPPLAVARALGPRAAADQPRAPREEVRRRAPFGPESSREHDGVGPLPKLGRAVAAAADRRGDTAADPTAFQGGGVDMMAVDPGRTWPRSAARRRYAPSPWRGGGLCGNSRPVVGRPAGPRSRKGSARWYERPQATAPCCALNR